MQRRMLSPYLAWHSILLASKISCCLDRFFFYLDQRVFQLIFIPRLFDGREWERMVGFVATGWNGVNIRYFDWGRGHGGSKEFEHLLHVRVVLVHGLLRFWVCRRMRLRRGKITIYNRSQMLWAWLSLRGDVEYHTFVLRFLYSAFADMSCSDSQSYYLPL